MITAIAQCKKEKKEAKPFVAPPDFFQAAAAGGDVWGDDFLRPLPKMAAAVAVVKTSEVEEAFLALDAPVRLEAALEESPLSPPFSPREFDWEDQVSTPRGDIELPEAVTQEQWQAATETQKQQWISKYDPQALEQTPEPTPSTPVQPPSTLHTILRELDLEKYEAALAELDLNLDEDELLDALDEVSGMKSRHAVKIAAAIRACALESTPAPVRTATPDAPSKAKAIMEKMGWKEGEGLGKNGQGRCEPIAAVELRRRSGLGSGSEKSDDNSSESDNEPAREPVMHWNVQPAQAMSLGEIMEAEKPKPKQTTTRTSQKAKAQQNSWNVLSDSPAGQLPKFTHRPNQKARKQQAEQAAAAQAAEAEEGWTDGWAEGTAIGSGTDGSIPEACNGEEREGFYSKVYEDVQARSKVHPQGLVGK